MPQRIESAKDLQKLRMQAKAGLELRTGPKEIQITVHMGTCGIAAGARDVLATLADELGKVRVENVTLRQSGCLGLCDREPMLTLVDKDGHEFRYGKLDRKKVGRIVQDHVLAGNPAIEYLITK